GASPPIEGRGDLRTASNYPPPDRRPARRFPPFGDRSGCAIIVVVDMNWIDTAWTMMAAASLTLGLVHLLVWFKQRSRYAHLAFFVLATSVAAFSAFELTMMRAQAPTDYAAVLRW